MISILDTINKKPSKAIWFALQGIKNQKKRKDFEIDLNTFGEYSWKGSIGGEICRGCIAICAVQEISRKDLSGIEICNIPSRAAWLGFDQEELKLFEDAIDGVRSGLLRRLLRFCEVSDHATNILSKEFFNQPGYGYPDKTPCGLDHAIHVLEFAFEYLEANNM